MRKFNPALMGMVKNYRTELAQHNTPTTAYTDEELYRVIDFWDGTSDSNEQLNAVMDDVRAGTKY